MDWRSYSLRERHKTRRSPVSAALASRRLFGPTAPKLLLAALLQGCSERAKDKSGRAAATRRPVADGELVGAAVRHLPLSALAAFSRASSMRSPARENRAPVRLRSFQRRTTQHTEQSVRTWVEA